MTKLRVKLLWGLLAMAGPAASAQAAPDDALWDAIAVVESGGDAHAYNPRDGGTGIVQIRTVCLADVNRIAAKRGLDERFQPADRKKPTLARRMWAIYLGYYGKHYEQRTGRTPTPEVYARIWNGGPDGWRKRSTRGYWQRVRRALESDTG